MCTIINKENYGLNLLCEAMALLEVQNTTVKNTIQRKTNNQSRKYERNAEGKFMCPDCNYTAKNSSTMSMHYTKNHVENNKTHKCNECDAVFCHSTGLTQHIQRHHRAATIPCKYPDCNEVFKMKIDAKKHYVRYHMKDIHTHDKVMREDKNICVTCNGAYTGRNIHAHVSICHPCSPFVKIRE
jgi:uncharacterized C2H2 Zn-finger protein